MVPNTLGVVCNNWAVSEILKSALEYVVLGDWDRYDVRITISDRRDSLRYAETVVIFNTDLLLTLGAWTKQHVNTERLSECYSAPQSPRFYDSLAGCVVISRIVPSLVALRTTNAQYLQTLDRLENLEKHKPAKFNQWFSIVIS
ncbi:hypothetical protein Y032_0148g2668 [Ancylostoma ceylanicum]|uniref:Uncharacterized protein n=1 Tax=Ancylostoma ceylanicum TaxID=53326 RepID=A0A016T278_9BILA|nr:hypothetical protein Y032_0148g2668 [Ancylostoma ceylanicum]